MPSDLRDAARGPPRPPGSGWRSPPPSPRRNSRPPRNGMPPSCGPCHSPGVGVILLNILDGIKGFNQEIELVWQCHSC